MLTLTPLASDNFQRANENPLSQGGNWSVDSHNDAPLQIVSEVCESTASFVEGAELYTGGISIPNDQYASVTVGTFANNGPGLVVGVRITDNGSNYISLPGYEFFFEATVQNWSVRYEDNVILSGSGFTASPGDVFTIAVVGTTIYVFHNSTQLGSVSNSSVSSGINLLAFGGGGNVDEAQATNFVIGSASVATTYSISGNAGVASATVSWSGTSMGSTTADGSGNYTISGLSDGPYTITPSLAGYSFSPTSRNETVSGSNITGVNFTASTSSAWSPEDCRHYGDFPLTPVVVQGSKIYALDPNSSNPGLPPTDSRKDKPVDDRKASPQNSRVNPNPHA